MIGQIQSYILFLFISNSLYIRKHATSSYIIYVVSAIFILLGLLKSDTNDWKQLFDCESYFPHINFSSILLYDLRINIVCFSSRVLVHQLSIPHIIVHLKSQNCIIIHANLMKPIACGHEIAQSIGFISRLIKYMVHSSHNYNIRKKSLSLPVYNCKMDDCKMNAKRWLVITCL